MLTSAKAQLPVDWTYERTVSADIDLLSGELSGTVGDSAAIHGIINMAMTLESGEIHVRYTLEDNSDHLAGCLQCFPGFDAGR